MRAEIAKRLVRRGYDDVSFAYRGDEPPQGTGYAEWAHDLALKLENGDQVLDLGCGNGIPIAQRLSSRFNVTGVDISDVNLARAARALVPDATFHRADMTQIRFEPATFAAVVSLFAFIHVPVSEQPDRIRRIATRLRPGGRLLAIVGHEAWTGVKEDWHGGTMYWSHADSATYRRWLEMSGFSIEQEAFVPEGDTGHVLFSARLPSVGAARPRTLPSHANPSFWSA